MDMQRDRKEMIVRKQKKGKPSQSQKKGKQFNEKDKGCCAEYIIKNSLISLRGVVSRKSRVVAELINTHLGLVTTLLVSLTLVDGVRYIWNSIRRIRSDSLVYQFSSIFQYCSSSSDSLTKQYLLSLQYTLGFANKGLNNFDSCNS